jgi:hypothetical protein
VVVLPEPVWGGQITMPFGSADAFLKSASGVGSMRQNRYDNRTVLVEKAAFTTLLAEIGW